MLNLENICFSWRDIGREHNIGPISFDLKRGQIVGLFGSSGSGKSSILRVISGELKPKSGNIIKAHELSSIIYHDQEKKLIPWLSANKNALININTTSTRIKSIFEVCGLLEFGERKPAMLSGGQKARVAFARSLIQDSDVKLFDEPFTGIDSLNREKLIDFVHVEKQNVGMIITTHDPAILIQLCDTVVCLKQNRISVSSNIFRISHELHRLSPEQRRNHPLYVQQLKDLQGMLYG